MNAPSQQLITQYAYAKRRGCTHRAVQKAIESGRLVKALHRQGDKLLVDPIVADKEWAQNTDTSKPSNTVAPRKGDSAAAAKPAGAQLAALVATTPPATQSKPAHTGTAPIRDAEDGPLAGMHISQSRAMREAYLAKLAKLDYEERAGQLIDAEETRRLVYKAAREARNAFKALPDTIADKLFTAPDIFTCRRILDEAVNRICEQLFDAASKATQVSAAEGADDGGA